MQKKIDSNNAPKAAGPYSQSLKVGDFVFVSGQIGLDPKTNRLVDGGIEKETKQALKNLLEILKSAKMNIENVAKVEIFITNMENFALVNDIYSSFFTKNPKPARQTIGVNSLPKGASIEISAIGYAKK